jgi:hypothetical protein
MRLAHGGSLQSQAVGGGEVIIASPGEARLQIPPKRSGYANAQLDDYRSLSRRYFPWRPPVRMSLRARCSHMRPLGTLGFGFWNDPFSLSFGGGGGERRLPAPPCAVWYFYGSAPNDFGFVAGSPGSGFRAMALQFPQLPSPLFSALAAAGWALTKVPPFRGALMKAAISRVQSAEHPLSDLELDSWHTYQIHWKPDAVAFQVDSFPVMRAELSIQGPLGFVTWIDNQYAIASPSVGLEFGVIPTTAAQQLEIDDLRLVGA